MNTRVSVIIPTYNRAGYLREALVSIFNQTLPPWEVIVVNDGSTDNTDQVIRDAKGSVLVHRQDHRGVAAARNLGLTHARGDLIAWLDSDDLWEPDFLATVVPLLAQDLGLDGVYTGITMIDAQGTALRTSGRIEPPAALYDALVRDCFLATPSLVIRKKCYDQTGGFDPELRISEDYDMWLNLARRCRIEGISRPLVRIRVHGSNTMSDVDTACAARLRLTERHFGRLEGDGSHLAPAARVAYAYAFRSIALQYLEGGRPDSGWPYLAKAAALHPPILARLDTFYELALGDQSRGNRGDATSLDLAANGADMLHGLDSLFESAGAPVKTQRDSAYGNAYLALGMLADQAGEWAAARCYLLRAVGSNPRLLRDGSVMRRLAKVTAGHRSSELVKRVLGKE